MRSASASLCNATDGRAYYGEVTIIIPESWGDFGEGFDVLNWPRNAHADIVINQEHPLFGSQPITLQVINIASFFKISVDFYISVRQLYDARIAYRTDMPVGKCSKFEKRYCFQEYRLIIFVILIYQLSILKDAQLIHEWFHYRYGVYDEMGVSADPFFPSGFTIQNLGGEIHPTSCTKNELIGEWINKLVFLFDS